MDLLIALFIKVTNDAYLARLIVMSLLALATFIISICFFAIIFSNDRKTRKRVKSLTDSDVRKSLLTQQDVRKEPQGQANDALEKFLTPQNTKERDEKNQLLRYAGFYGKNAITTFFAIKTAATIGGLLLVLLYVSIHPEISIREALSFAVVISAVTMIFPNVILRRLAKKRQRLLRSAFPDALDLLVVCVEAGTGLDSAFQKTSDALALSAPELSDELALVNVSLRLGMTRIQALQNMVHRTGLREIKGLVSVIDQSARYGTSVADSLRVYAQEFRDVRRQELEEAAAKVSTKLIFPLLLCIWPSFFVVAAGPALMTLQEAFGG